MAKKKYRVNPRRKPAIKADVVRAKNQAERAAVIGTIAIPLMAAHDVYSFGPDRLARLLDQGHAGGYPGTGSARQARKGRKLCL